MAGKVATMTKKIPKRKARPTRGIIMEISKERGDWLALEERIETVTAQ